jgi:predicted Zn-dependent peptidase
MTARTIRTSQLTNGAQVISQEIPEAHTTALGIWLLNGGRHQSPVQSGYAHLLEHLWFKGTPGRDARALARRFEAMGGRINAYTGREISALHGLVPAEDAIELAGLFVSMLLDPQFDDQDLDRERSVVLQEMAMVADNPEEAIEESAIAQVWPGHPMGWPILGQREVIQNATAEGLRQYLQGTLSGGRIGVIASGVVAHDTLWEVSARLASLPAEGAPSPTPPRFNAAQSYERRSVAQSHLLWVMPAPRIAHPDYPALLVANHALGGGLSSRLFQELRERRGLVYTIDSRLDLYSDTGLWLIQTACEPKYSSTCRAAVEECVATLASHGPTPEELEVSQRHLRADFLTDEDDPEARVERLARDALYLGYCSTLEERLEQLARVKPQEAARVLYQAWNGAAYFEWSP